MAKYREMLNRTKENVHYWTQIAMRGFVTGVLRRMDARNMSRADLAAAMKVSPAYVSKMFRGDANFTLESMVKIARSVGGHLDVRIVESEAAVMESWQKVNVPQAASHDLARVVQLVPNATGEQWRKHVVEQDDNYCLAA